MSTLPLYWRLSSASKDERIDASVDLVSSLQQFQLDYVPEPYLNGHATEGDGEGGQHRPESFIDSITSEDVRYALRRLTRGLASPKESSRLGFAVALTELLSRMPVVSAGQVITLIMSASEITAAVRGQQLRDLLFARLFGFNCLVHSGLLFKTESLPSTSIPASTLSDFQTTVSNYIGLGEQKSWLRETAWWSLLGALDALHSSSAPWKDEAVNFAVTRMFKDKEWSPEKFAAVARLQQKFPTVDWRSVLSPTFKDGQILSLASLSKVALVLREVDVDAGDEDDGVKSAKQRIWKPELHFAWDALIDLYFTSVDLGPNVGPRNSSIHDFFRIAVDENFFQNATTAERRFWGFSVCRRILIHITPSDIPQLFTPHFSRAWINNLSSKDKALNKVAKELVNDLKTIVEKHPEIGFKVVMALIGSTDGNVNRLRDTKLLESILGSMDVSGVKSYLEHLVDSVYDASISDEADDSSSSTKKWAIDQISTVLRSHDLPKDDNAILYALQFFVVHGFFQVKKKSKDSPISVLRRPPPTISEELHALCRQQLYSCLVHLLRTKTPSQRQTDGTAKSPETTERKQWVTKSLEVVHMLEQDSKHVSLLDEGVPEDSALRKAVRKTVKQLGKKEGRTSSGVVLLLEAYALRSYDEAFEQQELLSELVDAIVRLAGLEPSTKKQPSGEEGESLEPIDVVLDSLLADLETETTFRREVANYVFEDICHEFKDSSMDLLLAQITPQRSLGTDSDEEMDEVEVEDEVVESDEQSEESESDSSSDTGQERSSDDDDDDAPVDPEFRRRIAQALQMEDVLDEENASSEEESGTSDADDDDESGEEELMDDDQMMALDEKLAEVFRTSQATGKGKKGAQRQAIAFKTRVVDFLETFIRQNPTSNHILRTLNPLIHLAALGSREEDHLSKKAAKVIKTVVGRPENLIENLDTDSAVEALKAVHSTAAKVQGVDAASIFAPCCRLLIRNLTNAGQDSAIQELYTIAINGFFARKQSKFPYECLRDFVRTSPSQAVRLRRTILDYCKPKEAASAFKQLQAVELVKELFYSSPPANKTDGIGEDLTSFVPDVASVVRGILSNETSKETGLMSAAQLRDLAQNLIAIIKKTESKGDDASKRLSTVWNPDNVLAPYIQAIKELKSSPPLNQRLDAFLKLVTPKRQVQNAKKRKKADAKPQGREGDEDAESTPKPKKKKKKQESRAGEP